MHKSEIERDFKRGRYNTLGNTDSFTDTYSDLILFDPLRDYMPEEILELTNNRINRIHRNWRYYLGKQFDQTNDDGQEKVVINYSKKFVDKSNAFLFGKGWLVSVPWAETDAKAARTVVDELDRVWKENKKDILSNEMGQQGGVTGDVFVQVTYVDKIPDPKNKGEFLELTKKDERRGVKLSIVNSLYAHPIYDSTDKRKLKAVIIQFPVFEPIIVDGNKQGKKVHVFTQLVTDEEVVEWMDKIETNRMKNVLGEINIVHIPNTVISGATFGFADIDGFVALQDHFNTKNTDVSDIIDYHAGPITILYGVRASELQKGANRVWSGFPKDAKVENLELQGDLKASQDFIKSVKTYMHELAGIPEFTLGKELAISNTSAVALHTLYMPLIELTNTKRATYGDGIERINRLILKYLEIKEDLVLPNERGKYRTEIKFADPLPKDRLIELNMISMELDKRLESRKGALMRLGYDPDKKMAEILNDGPIIDPMAVEQEKARIAGVKKMGGKGDIAQTPQTEQQAQTAKEEKGE